MASLYDVAARAGVSKTLVSRMINGQTGVGKVSREKISRAMEELGYVPNAVARSLALRETGSIGVVLDNLCEPYFFELIRGIEEAIDKSRFDVLFCSARNDRPRKERSIRYFSEGRADGVIIYGSLLDDAQLIEAMSKRSFPFVVVENETDFDGVNTILLDNVRGAEMAVDHLVNLGCRNIWHFTGDMKRTISLSRMEGYRRAMKRHNLPVRDAMIVESDFERQVGYLQMKQMLRLNRDELPDGIFFAGDVTAYGAIQALKEEGVAIPGRVKIVGFDDDQACIPQGEENMLSTLRQPLFNMGVEAVNVLIASIEDSKALKCTKLFTPELVVRRSTIG